MVDLTTKFLGLTLRNPLIVGSSGLTDTVEQIKAAEQEGAGAVVLKSLFEEEIIAEMDENMHRMTSRHFIYPETFDYMDEEHEEDSVRKYLRLISESKASVKIPVIASINCVTAQKWMYFASEIQNAGADALELNLFILPTDFERSAADNEQLYFDIVKQVKKVVSIPVLLKISYYSSNLGQLIQKLSATGIEGITLFNRFYSPDFNLETYQVVSTNVLSNPTDLAISLRWIAVMADRVKCDLAASTGVHDGEAMIKQILAGANAVQVVSTLYRHGIGYIHQMLDEMKKWMEHEGYQKLDDFRGKMSQNRSSNPAAFERVQFMKSFRHYIHQ
ncbi:MAG: dihydroorotate dehydrogenase-like protein [Sphingobacteriia bacterium]|nr:dihydroorotate dehydrogenase-like protein [Sphingobacteriia bacterium]